jgi:hypothetical protein
MGAGLEKMVSCNYMWPESTRSKLKSISLWTHISMTNASSLAVDLLYNVLEVNRREGMSTISVDQLIDLLKEKISTHPEYADILRAAISKM